MEIFHLDNKYNTPASCWCVAWLGQSGSYFLDVGYEWEEVQDDGFNLFSTRKLDP